MNKNEDVKNLAQSVLKEHQTKSRDGSLFSGSWHWSWAPLWAGSGSSL